MWPDTQSGQEKWINMVISDYDHDALHQNALAGDLMKVERLLSKGADVTVRNDKGMTPLDCAASEGFKNVVEMLIEHGSAIDAVSPEDGMTAVHWATLFGHQHVVAYLIGKGAVVTRRDKFGCAPLHYAAQWGYGGIVNLLLQRRVDPNLINSKGCIALHDAANASVADLLVAANSAIESHAMNGRTPLAMAAYYGRFDVVQFLVSAGAKVNARDSKNKTPLVIAATEGHMDVAIYLRNCGGIK